MIFLDYAVDVVRMFEIEIKKLSLGTLVSPHIKPFEPVVDVQPETVNGYGQCSRDVTNNTMPDGYFFDNIQKYYF